MNNSTSNTSNIKTNNNKNKNNNKTNNKTINNTTNKNNTIEKNNKTNKTNNKTNNTNKKPFECPKCTTNKNTLKLTSDALKNGFTNTYLKNSNKQITPDLEWTPVPDAKSYALLCVDPDSSTPWKHWVLLNIPSEITRLPSSEPVRDAVWKLEKDGQEYNIIQGKNSWDYYGYEGPAPPPGTGVHRYYFCLYALDIDLSQNNDNKITEAIEDHVLACGHMMHKFGK